MIGIILAGGLGTRLGSEASSRPKCMVDVGGKPVLERVADHMNKHGIWTIVVNLHIFPQVVMKRFGQRFLYLYEPVPTGEFATVSLVRSHWGFKETVVQNGDTLTDLDLTKEIDEGVSTRFCVGGKHMGTTFLASGNMGWVDKEVNCWHQDMGTPSGLSAARKHYGE